MKRNYQIVTYPKKKLAVLVLSIIMLPVLGQEESNNFSAVLPTIEVEAMSEEEITKGYINYEDAKVTRDNRSVKEIPRSIETLNIQKNKNYGTNDLSSILEGNAGISTTYDMRSDEIHIRGFRADNNDIYRDGIRESGQVRRSTANIERIEILKGPASVLYGRGGGGGVINMISKYASFETQRNIGVLYGSWANRGATFDFNQAVNDNVAIRLVGDYMRANSFRSGIDSKSRMFSPSVTVNAGNLTWTGQYTYDYAHRTPDRGPTKSEYDAMGISYRQSFARSGDFVEDDTQTFRSEMDLMFNDNWSLNWLAGYRQAAQNFDHYYAGSFDKATQLLTQRYAWQETDNKTLSSNLTLNGEFNTGAIEHRLTIGGDISRENRNPLVAFTTADPINPYDQASWPSDTVAAVNFDNKHKATSHGLFVQDVISLTPEFKISLGGRYDTYRFSSTDKDNNSSSYDGNSFSPNAGVVWDVTSDHTLYASYSKSFSPYGGNGNLGVSASSDPDTFNADPERNEQYEIGIKSDWQEGRLSTTLAAYQIEHKNIRYRPDSNNPLLWKVRGKERSRGFEINATGQIFPDWYVRSSLGWMKTEIVEDKSNPQNIGNRLDGTGDFSGNIFVRYAPGEKLYGELGVTHIGKRYYYNRRGDESTIDSFTRVDALLGWKAKNWNATIGVTNLLDTDYWRSDAMPGAPRAVTGRFSYQF